MLNRRILNVTATMMTLLFSASLILASEPVDLGLLKIESLAQQADIGGGLVNGSSTMCRGISRAARDQD